ncbi:hypothetical protein HPG69_005102 [Diceros bicornis minor]|uniref:Uncharacterized protein n=1 Tax=Diceros bicornis minor TaxID=77932 RepID=A0A7J7EEN4_DICBM|nr:hypothetical protein HPG69_005102 [Diceros bicornis minor]
MELWRTGLLVPKGHQRAYQALWPKERRPSGRDSAPNPRVFCSAHGPLSFPGLIFTPGMTQLTAKDILYRLRASKAKCTVASEDVVPAVESIVSEYPYLKTKLLLCPHSQNGWLSFQELFQSTPARHSCVLARREVLRYHMEHVQHWLGQGRHWQCVVFLASGSRVFVHQMAQFNSDTFLDIQIEEVAALTGGEPHNPEVLEQWKEQTGLELYEGYGQTEVYYKEKQKISGKKNLDRVKAFVVLSALFKSSNLEKLTLELQDHVKKSTATYKYPRKARQCT